MGLASLNHANGQDINYSTDNHAGEWSQTGTWTGTPIPDYDLGNYANANDSLHIYGFVVVRNPATIADPTVACLGKTNSKTQLVVHDTLVVEGDLVLGTDASITIKPGAILIVKGNFETQNKFDIGVDAMIVVTGDFNTHNNHVDVNFGDEANIYIFGDIDPAVQDSLNQCYDGSYEPPAGSLSSDTCNVGDSLALRLNEVFPVEDMVWTEDFKLISDQETSACSNCDGSITYSVTGGYRPYTLSWYSGAETGTDLGKRPILFTSTMEFTNQPIRLYVGWDYGMEDDFSDIRIQDEDGNDYDFWIDRNLDRYMEQDQAIIWVNVPQINIGNNLMYVVWNTGLGDASSHANTMIQGGLNTNYYSWLGGASPTPGEGSLLSSCVWQTPLEADYGTGNITICGETNSDSVLVVMNGWMEMTFGARVKISANNGFQVTFAPGEDAEQTIGVGDPLIEGISNTEDTYNGFSGLIPVQIQYYDVDDEALFSLKIDQDGGTDTITVSPLEFYYVPDNYDSSEGKDAYSDYIPTGSRTFIREGVCANVVDTLYVTDAIGTNGKFAISIDADTAAPVLITVPADTSLSYSDATITINSVTLYSENFFSEEEPLSDPYGVWSVSDPQGQLSTSGGELIYTGEPGGEESSISYSFSAENYYDVTITTNPYQSRASNTGGWDSSDYLEIEYSTNGGTNWTTLINDPEVWTATNNSTEGTPATDGNNSPTEYSATLPAAADSNATLAVRISFMADEEEEIYRVPQFSITASQRYETIDTTLTGGARGNDDYDTDPEITYSDVITYVCESEFFIERTWTITDDCGNYDTGVQNIAVGDAPSFTEPLVNDTIICNYDSIWALRIPYATDGGCVLDSLYSNFTGTANWRDNMGGRTSDVDLDVGINTIIWTAVDSAGISTNDTVIVTVDPPLTVAVSALSPSYDVCEGEEVITEVTASGGSGSYVTYSLWENGTTEVCNGASNSCTTSFTPPGYFYVWFDVTDSRGCSANNRTNDINVHELISTDTIRIGP